MVQRELARCLLLLAGLAALPASATEWLSSEDLDRHCDAFLEREGERRSGDACLSFLQGYLAGAEAARELAAAYEERAGAARPSQDETFAERATRRRAGSYLGRFSRPGSAPRYCLPEDAAPAAVVSRVIEHLRTQTGEDDLTAAQAIHRALVGNFPCEDG